MCSSDLFPSHDTQGFSIEGLCRQFFYQNAVKRVASNTVDKDFDITTMKTGCKTETRRMRGLKEINKNPDGWELWNVFVEDGKDVNPMVFQDGRVVWNFANTGEFKNHQIAIQCPYGVVGDELWVKEAYDRGFFGVDGGVNRVHYAADGVDGNLMKWKSPMFMPKAASRIKLEITGIGLERLHDITEEGAMREGVTLEGIASSHGHLNYRMAFAVRWTELHNNYNSNPWVWVIQFTVKEFKI